MHKLISIAHTNISKIYDLPALKHQLDIEKYFTASRATEGNHGVALVYDTDDNCFVVKREEELSPLIFSLFLSQELGFLNPSIQIYDFDDEFSQDLVTKCLETELLKKYGEFSEARTIVDDNIRTVTMDKLKLKYQTNSLNSMFSSSNESGKYLLVMDFNQGMTLKHLDVLQGTPTQQKGLFKDLGRLLAFDLLIHNTDRLPLDYFKSQSNEKGQLEGNAGNLMIEYANDKLELVLIDNTVMRSRIDYGSIQQFDLFCTLETMLNPLEDSNDLESVNVFIDQFLPQSTPVNRKDFRKGLLHGIKEISRLTFEDVDAMFIASQKIDPDTPFDLNYIKKGIDIFKFIAAKYPTTSISSNLYTVIKDTFSSPTPDKFNFLKSRLNGESDSELVAKLNEFEEKYTEFINSKKDALAEEKYRNLKNKFMEYILLIGS